MIATVSELQTAAPRHDEGRPVSRAREAAALGISARHWRRLRAAERAGTAEWVEPEAERPGADELPYVELAEGPRRRLHYNLDDDEASRLPGGPFRVGRGRGGRLQVAHRDDDRRVRDGDSGDEPTSAGRCVTDEDRAAGVVYVQAVK